MRDVEPGRQLALDLPPQAGQSSPRPTRTCADGASNPEVIRHTWRSTFVTPGAETIARATASASIPRASPPGIAVESRSTPHALATIDAIASETSVDDRPPGEG